MTAYVFFYFTSVLPRLIAINRSKKISGEQVHWILYDLFVLINQILNVYEIKSLIDKVQERELIHIDGNKKNNISGFYKISEHWRSYLKKRKQFTGVADMPFQFPDTVYGNLANIPVRISKLRQLNSNYQVDESFSEILSSIETSRIIEWYANGKNEMFRFANSSQEMYSQILDYRRLKKLSYHLKFRNSFTKIHFYTKEEIENIKNEQDRFHEKLVAIRQKQVRLNPCIIYNNKCEDYIPILSLLRIRNFHIYEEYDKEILPFEENHCLVIIEKGIPASIIKDFTRKNRKDKLIIKLRPHYFKSTKLDKYKDKETKNGVYILYYRVPIELGKIVLFKANPTRSILDRLKVNYHEIITNFKEAEK